MTNWMRRMGIGGANSTLPLLNTSMAAVLSYAPYHYHKPIPCSYTTTPPNLLSFLTPRHRFHSAPPSCSPVPSLNPDHDFSDFGDGHCIALSRKGSKVLLKGMTYTELEKWVQSHGYRPGQAMMLWKRIYGNSIWAHHSDELEGLNKHFKKMLSENAEFKALSLKEVCTASDGTRKDIADFVHIG